MKKVAATFFALLLFAAGEMVAATFLSAEQSQDAWQSLKGEDFVVFYRSDIPDDYAQTTLDTAEEELQRVTDNLGIVEPPDWSGKNRIKIFIYSGHDDYVKNGGQATWSHGVAFAQAKTIKMYPDAAGFFDSLLPHELGHIVFRHYIGYNIGLPLWFEEGVAIYQEKAKRFGSNKIVQQAIENGQFISLTDLSGMRLYKTSNNEAVDLFYAESASAVYYMITELGDREFTMLCNQIKDNVPFDEALHQVYLRFKKTADLNEAWVEYLQEK